MNIIIALAPSTYMYLLNCHLAPRQFSARIFYPSAHLATDLVPLVIDLPHSFAALQDLAADPDGC